MGLSNALTRDELIEAMQPLGNRPVVWSGTASSKDAVGAVVLTHNNGVSLISLAPAMTQSNVGNVLTSTHISEAREALRVAKNRFAESFALFVDGHITKNDFVAIKRDYDFSISQVIDVLQRA
jgi:hypothetical protein